MRKITLLTLLILLSTAIQATSPDWRHFRFDAMQNGLTQAESKYNLNQAGILWSFTAGGSINSSPVAGDLDKDGLLEVVFGSEDGYVYAFKNSGQLAWMYNANGKVISSPTLADINQDGRLEVIAGTVDGKIHAISPEGRRIWVYTAKGPVELEPAVVDLYGNHQGLEIVFKAGKWIQALSSNGVEIQNYRLSETLNNSLILADINKDGSLEIGFVTSGNTIYILNKFFTQMKKIKIQSEYISQLTAFDFDKNGIPDFVFASLDKGVYKVHHTTYTGVNSCYTDSCLREAVDYLRTYPYWNSKSGSSIMKQLSMADLDDDGTPEVILQTGNRTLHLYDTNRSILVPYTINAGISTLVSIGDLDGDKKPEVIFGAGDGNLYMINYPFGEKYVLHVNSSVQTNPVLADLTKDKKLEVIFGCRDGTIYVLGDSHELDSQRAVNLLEEARQKISEGDQQKALEKAGEALAIYLRLKDKEGMSNASKILQQVNTSKSGDIYLQDAKDSYIMHNLKDSESSAREAIRIYTRSGNNAGVENTASLLKDINTHLEAEANYKNGVREYNLNGPTSEALQYLNMAKTGYESVRYTPGVAKTEAVIKRMNGDIHLSKALEYYNNSQFNESITEAKQSLDIFYELNFEDGINASADIIYNSTRMISTVGKTTDYTSLILLGVLVLIILLAVFLGLKLAKIEHSRHEKREK